MSRSLFGWLDVLSELLINLSAGWFSLVFIEPQINPKVDLLTLTVRLSFGILSLVVAKYFREKIDSYEKFY